MDKTEKLLLLSAPESQLDASMLPLIKKWDSPPTSLQLLEVLDHCIHGSLASGSVVAFLQSLYAAALKREHKEHSENVPKATWRNLV